MRKSEQMLEEDALRFDAFLKENDEKVQEAIKRAEMEAKAKQDKVHEIKRLSAAITTIRSELNKCEEQLEDCRKYKDFLDHLTPPEFFKEQAELKAKRQAERKARKEEKKAARLARFHDAQKAAALAAAEEAAELGEDIEAAAAAVRAPLKPSRSPQPSHAFAAGRFAVARTPTSHGRDMIGCGDTGRQAAATVVMDPTEEEDNEEDEEALDDMAMYFQRPTQLLDIFAQLEEQNLFLIQNCQETEEALEELKTKYKETKLVMDGETDSLKAQVDTLQGAILTEEDKSKALRERTNHTTQGGLGGKGAELDSLATKVTEVYVRCGFEADASVSSLQMLTNIEAKLEEYLAAIDQMPEDFVEVAEKQKEKERRSRIREEKQEQMRIEQERRVQRSLERAQAPVHKKQGKPLMFRSAPPLAKRRTDDDGPKKTDEEEELAQFLVREF